MEELFLPTEFDSQNTESLLRAAETGDQAALNELIDLHRSFLHRVVELRLDSALQGRVDASDIVQETQMVATRRISDFLQRRPTSFKLWLRGEAMQQIGMQRRRHFGAARRSVERECSISDASSLLIARNMLAGTPSKIVERREMAAKVRSLIEGMSELDREILVLRYIEDLNNTEAAELLEIDQATARKRHGRALKRFLELIIENGLANTNGTGQE